MGLRVRATAPRADRALRAVCRRASHGRAGAVSLGAAAFGGRSGSFRGPVCGACAAGAAVGTVGARAGSLRPHRHLTKRRRYLAGGGRFRNRTDAGIELQKARISSAFVTLPVTVKGTSTFSILPPMFSFPSIL